MGYIDDHLIQAAWEDSALIKRAFPSLASFREHTKAYHADTPQIQLSVWDMVCVGGIVLAPSLDPMVGLSLMAMHTFVHADYRSTAVLKALRRGAQKVAREAGIRWIIYPRRTPQGVLHNYEEVPNGRSS